MSDTTHEAPDDLMTRLKNRLKALYDDPREYSPGQISEASVMALTRIEELEAKLAAERGRIASLERRLKLWVPQNISETGRWPIREGGE